MANLPIGAQQDECKGLGSDWSDAPITEPLVAGTSLAALARERRCAGLGGSSAEIRCGAEPRRRQPATPCTTTDKLSQGEFAPLSVRRKVSSRLERAPSLHL